MDWIQKYQPQKISSKERIITRISYIRNNCLLELVPAANGRWFNLLSIERIRIASLIIRDIINDDRRIIELIVNGIDI